jgi:hypothetical protein
MSSDQPSLLDRVVDILDEFYLGSFDISENGVHRMERYPGEHIRGFFESRSTNDLRDLIASLFDLMADRSQRVAAVQHAVRQIHHAMADLCIHYDVPTVGDLTTLLPKKGYASQMDPTDPDRPAQALVEAVADWLTTTRLPNGERKYEGRKDGREWTPDEVKYTMLTAPDD